MENTWNVKESIIQNGALSDASLQVKSVTKGEHSS